MKKIYLSPLLSLAIILAVSVGAGWMVLSTAQKVSEISDNYSSIEPTATAQAAKAHGRNRAATASQTLDTPQVQ